MKFPGVVVLILSFCCGTAAGQEVGTVNDSLTIEQAISRVLATHPAVVQASAGVDAATARIEAAHSGYYPQVSVDASYTHLGPGQTLDFPGLGEFRLYPQNNYDAHVGLNELLFDFGRRAAGVDISETGVQQATDNMATVRTGLAFQTIQSFYAILFLQQSLEVQAQEIAALQQHLDYTQKRLEGGSGTEFDVITTRVRVASAETRRIDLHNMLRNQELAISRLLGQPQDATPKVKGSFDLVPIALGGDSLTALAFAHRSELALTRDALRAADLQHQLAGIQDMPSLSMGFMYGLKNGYFPNLDVLRGNWLAAFRLEVPLFNGFRTRSREDETEAMSRSAQASQSVVERSVTLEVQQAMEGVRSAREKVETSRALVQQALDAVRIARVQYEAGAATNLDLLDAETSVSQAELAQLSAVYQYTLNRYSLDRATGMLPVGSPSNGGNR